MARRTTRALRAAAISVAAMLVVGIALTAALLNVYLNPPVDDLEGVDAVFVLGPITSERIEVAQRIEADAGGDIPFIASKPRNGVCEDPSHICVDPVPATTKGEVAALRMLADEMGFEHPAIVTFTPHVARSRFIFDRCYGPGAVVVAADEELTIGEIAYQFAYQTAAFVKAALTPCAEEGRAGINQRAP